jgi:hypothetical protein
MVGEDNHDPTTMVVNTTTQHMHYTVPKAPLFEYDTPLNGRACKLDNGLRQWISEDGETGTF